MNFIKKHYLLIIIGLVMINNIEHLAYVHHDISRKLFGIEGSMIHSVIVVVIIELAIMAFVANGKKWFALLFTVLLFVLSMLYYDVRTFMILGNWEQLTASVVYSTLFTVSIYMFSEMYASKIETSRNVSETFRDGLEQDIRDLQAKLEETEAEKQEKDEEMDEQQKRFADTLSELEIVRQGIEAQYNKEKEEADKWREATTCGECGERFKSPFAKNAHKCKDAKLQDHIPQGQ
ncbi:hypothetical protein [Aureibacter tunicatorum]|uniref:Skp family chaperone for outer membrane proteins n=1 Tax=Aureibacter tunicatorum TaxID=866807 RepID=A0AAE3XQ22_9BACT|nr:hypothetical protein [Aureibacter tunicatorum]MDR6239954.1 Skp family chaperone for outer membrane proteins [Aureibacter tunicatorum]BDD04427.1 hypothetical protein AUTU_19100 [Aureibacter tunicatorum]